MTSSLATLQMLIDFASSGARYTTLMLKATKIFSIEKLDLEKFPFEKVIKVLQEKSKNASNIHAQQDFAFWGHYQYKVFVIVSICYGAMISKELSQLDNKDILFLKTLFPQKTTEFLLFHLRSLCEKKSYKKQWSEEENELLTSVMRDKLLDLRNEDIKTQWGEISYMLFVRSECSIYIPREKCREQWINHLDPTLNRGEWSKEEDILLFQLIIQRGKKWAQISRQFKGRNEHMIKNRYNSIVRKTQRKSLKNVDFTFERKMLEKLKKSSNLQKDPEPASVVIPEVEITFNDQLQSLHIPNVDINILEPNIYQDNKFQGWSFPTQQLQDFSLLEDNCFIIKENHLFFHLQL